MKISQRVLGAVHRHKNIIAISLAANRDFLSISVTIAFSRYLWKVNNRIAKVITNRINSY